MDADYCGDTRSRYPAKLDWSTKHRSFFSPWEFCFSKYHIANFVV